MHRNRRPWIVAVALAASCGWPVAAQEVTANDATPRVAQELAGIRQSLDRVTAVLEALLRNQKVDLLLERIALQERRLAPLESRLRGAEEEVAAAENEIRRLEHLLEENRQSLDDEIRDGTDRPESPTRNLINEIEHVLRDRRAHLDIVRARVVEYELDLGDSRDELEALDDLLKALLE